MLLTSSLPSLRATLVLTAVLWAGFAGTAQVQGSPARAADAGVAMCHGSAGGSADGCALGDPRRGAEQSALAVDALETGVEDEPGDAANQAPADVFADAGRGRSLPSMDRERRYGSEKFLSTLCPRGPPV